MKATFELQNAEWLDSNFEIPHFNNDTNEEAGSPSSGSGQPRIGFKTVLFSLHPILIDGKVLSIITNTPFMR